MKYVILIFTLVFSCICHATQVSGQAKAHAFQAMGFIDQPVYLTCQHGVVVQNDSTSKRMVSFTNTICTTNKDCESTQMKKKIGPGVYGAVNQTQLTPTYHHAGHFQLTCKTSIDGIASQEDTTDIAIN